MGTTYCDYSISQHEARLLMMTTPLCCRDALTAWDVSCILLGDDDAGWSSSS